MNIERTYRLYGFVPHNLSAIQQGIQFGHGAIEYSIEFQGTPEYKRWSQHDKTFIILNGGTTNTNLERLGSLNGIERTLFDRKVNYSKFYEPDLGDQLTAVVLLVDDRVWDREKYPDFSGVYVGAYVSTGFNSPKPANFNGEYDRWMSQFGETSEEIEQILFLRDYLKSFKLA
jgi:hypothetical protein